MQLFQRSGSPCVRSIFLTLLAVLYISNAAAAFLEKRISRADRTGSISRNRNSDRSLLQLLPSFDNSSPNISTSLLVNETSSGTFNDIDDDFFVAPEPVLPSFDLNKTATLIVGIKVLSSLAYQDYHGVTSTDTFTFRKHQSVFMVFSGRGGQRVPLQRQYALWGLYTSLSSMVNGGHFIPTIFAFYKTRRLLGSMLIAGSPVDLNLWAMGNLTTLLSSTNATEPATLHRNESGATVILEPPSVKPPPLDFSTFTLCRPDIDEDISTTFSPLANGSFLSRNPDSNLPLHRVSLRSRLHGQPLTLYQTFFTPAAALARDGLAVSPQELHALYFAMSIPEVGRSVDGTSLVIYERDDAATPLTYGWMILAMQLIPKIMLAARSFREMEAVIFVDGNPIGDLYLDKGSIRPHASVASE